MQTTVKIILDQKGRDVWSIPADRPVSEAIKLMAEKEIGALIVLEDERPVGLVSERDYARKVILKGKSSQGTQVRDIMSTKILYVHPETTVEQCMALMNEKKVRHLPVLDGSSLVGMLSIRDLLRAIIDDQKYTIEQLERYITG